MACVICEQENSSGNDACYRCLEELNERDVQEQQTTPTDVTAESRTETVARPYVFAEAPQYGHS